MTDRNTISALLDSMAGILIAYEPGDVMNASAALSLAEKLRAACEGCDPADRICGRLVQLAKEALTGSFTDFTGPASAGADMLRYVTETGTGQLPESKKAQIESWLGGQSTQVQTPAAAPVLPGADPGAAEDSPEQTDCDQLRQFVSDCEERLSAAQDLILTIETRSGDAESVKELFRVFHTIKGECGFLKLSRLGSLAHTIESMLDDLRSGRRAADAHVTDMLLEGLDLARAFTAALKDGDFKTYAGIPSGPFTDKLARFLQNGIPEAPAGSSGGHAPVPEPPKQDGQSVRKNESADTVIKVKAGKITYLTDMIGELLISLGQMKDDTEGLAQVRKTARLLQYAGMQLRTESVRVLFCTVRRIIRDTSQKVGKHVISVFEGEELEIDRTLIESLEEPLMHLVRNALDHGIESADERIREGKTPEGTVRVAAERKGNNIVISVGDDGRGLDRRKILSKAVEKGLVREQDAAGMSDAAVRSLIFVSGFSTNDKVDQISGRGVGMDIVKEAVVRAKGRIVTESTPGKGTVFSLYFPLSTAIIDGMLVRTGTIVFVIPIASIVESLKVKKEQVHKVAEKTDVLDLRGQMIPILRTAEIFGISGAGQGSIATIVEDSSGSRYACMSDELIAKREVVIKTLGPYFKTMQGISSCTVLPGGGVGYVLEIDQVVALGVNNE